jgi:hypothetical protein
MTSASRKSVAPFYAAAVVWIAYALFFPLYSPPHFAIVIVASVIVFAITAALSKKPLSVPASAPAAAAKPAEDKSTGNAELDRMIKDGNLAIAEMKRLDDNIKDEKISADIVHLEQVSQKIFDAVKLHPEKLPQIRKFMSYYLPTTLKLLNAYDRMSSQGVSGENIDATMKKIEDMTGTIATAFDKQLDSLFGDEALDISSDITVLETMMAREGFSGEQMHASETSPSSGPELKL